MSIWRNIPQSLINNDNNNIYLESLRINFNDEWIIVPVTLLTPSFTASQMLSYLHSLVASNFSLKMLVLYSQLKQILFFHSPSPSSHHLCYASQYSFFHPVLSVSLSHFYLMLPLHLLSMHFCIPKGSAHSMVGSSLGKGWDRQRKMRGHKQSKTTFFIQRLEGWREHCMLIISFLCFFFKMPSQIVSLWHDEIICGRLTTWESKRRFLLPQKDFWGEKCYITDTVWNVIQKGETCM